MYTSSISLVLRIMLAFIGVLAAYGGSVIAETYYVDAVLTGKSALPPLTSIFFLPYFAIMALLGSGLTCASALLTGGGALEVSIVIATILSVINAYVISNYLGSDAYFMYSADGSRAIAACFSLVAVGTVAISLGI